MRTRQFRGMPQPVQRPGVLEHGKHREHAAGARADPAVEVGDDILAQAELQRVHIAAVVGRDKRHARLERHFARDPRFFEEDVTKRLGRRGVRADEAPSPIAPQFPVRRHLVRARQAESRFAQQPAPEGKQEQLEGRGLVH